LISLFQALNTVSIKSSKNLLLATFLTFVTYFSNHICISLLFFTWINCFNNTLLSSCTTDNLAARLHGTRQALEALQEQGVEQIVFVTTLKTTTLSVAELLAEGGSWFALEHDGLGSRRLSTAQAESLKCRMR
jgi:hypothetical protein